MGGGEGEGVIFIYGGSHGGNLARDFLKRRFFWDYPFVFPYPWVKVSSLTRKPRSVAWPARFSNGFPVALLPVL